MRASRLALLVASLHLGASRVAALLASVRPGASRLAALLVSAGGVVWAWLGEVFVTAGGLQRRAARVTQRPRRRAPGAIVLVVTAGAVMSATGGPVPTTAAQDNCRVVEDFGKAGVGEFPEGWKARKDEAKNVYKVAEEGGKRFLRGDAKDLGIQAGKQFEWDLKQYPVLAWSWRAVEFPKGADERTGKNDSAAAVYAVFPHSKISVKSVKYIWSEKVPKGTNIPQTKGNTQGVVLRTGGGGDGWVEERVNVLEDYKRYFKTDEVPKPEGIGVLTDSDDTSSRARGDYARFRVCRG